MNIHKKIIPAIIAKKQEELDELLSKVINVVEIAQLDIMDNEFVPNTSLFFDFRLPKTSCIFEAHLMIANPKKWIEDNWQKVDTILVHYESCDDPKDIISLVKNKGKKIGFVLNPETPIERLAEFIGDIDQVLVMTVNPGFYGSPFLPEMLDKITELRNMKPDLDIEVDGGVTDKTISLVDKAGANLFVSGSYIMKADNVEDSINDLKKQLSL
jgi:ribulose-phosphate 3-epimerase